MCCITLNLHIFVKHPKSDIFTKTFFKNNKLLHHFLQFFQFKSFTFCQFYEIFCEVLHFAFRVQCVIGDFDSWKLRERERESAEIWNKHPKTTLTEPSNNNNMFDFSLFFKSFISNSWSIVCLINCWLCAAVSSWIWVQALLIVVKLSPTIALFALQSDFTSDNSFFNTPIESLDKVDISLSNFFKRSTSNVVVAKFSYK